MPRNGAGVFSLVSNTWFPPVNGVLATSTDWSTFIIDIQNALTQSVSSDGQTPMTGNLPMGNNKITGLATGTANTDAANIGNLNAVAGQAGGVGDRNLLVNGNFVFNQRVYVSGTATTAVNQLTLDRWRIPSVGQALTFGAAAPDRVVTAPSGSVEQIIEAGWVVGGVYTLSWTGTAAATVNGSGILNGGQTAVLPANTAIAIRFITGTVDRAQFELGTAATPYQRRPPGIELMLCQRDYAKSYALATTPGSATSVGRFFGAGNISGSLSWNVYLPVQMSAIPTVTLFDQNANINSVISFSSGGVLTTRAAVVQNQTQRTFEVAAAAVGADVAMTGQWFAATGV